MTESFPVMIYGADVVGRALVPICKKERMHVKGFVDFKPELQGTRIMGLPVIGPDNLPTDVSYVISVMSPRTVIDNLTKQGIHSWYLGGLWLNGIDTRQQDPSFVIDDDLYQIESCRVAHKAHTQLNHLFVRSIDIMITERCSLKCRDCSNLMQYFDRPRNFDTKNIMKDMDKFLASVDEVLEARIIGGDAFMHPQWRVVLNHAIASPKIRRVIVYTNGIIIPRTIELFSLTNPKVIVYITDYGRLSRNLEEIVALFKEYGVWHKIIKLDKWIDCATIEKHSRTEEENDALFRKCVATNLATLVDGRVFRCPYAASMYLLGKWISPSALDYVDDLSKRKMISTYLSSDKAMSVCNYCTGRILTNTIKPTIQGRRFL